MLLQMKTCFLAQPCLDRVLVLLEALRKIWRALELTRDNPKSRIETAVRFVPSSAIDPLGVTGNLVRKSICHNLRGGIAL